jgi:16S rRNA C1402 N4-methylase RsmH
LHSSKVLSHLGGADGLATKTFLDATFGDGGHGALIMEESKGEARLVAADRDAYSHSLAEDLKEEYPVSNE